MEVFVDNENIIKKESELIGSLFSFHGARVIELGCGSGAIATEIQGNFKLISMLHVKSTAFSTKIMC